MSISFLHEIRRVSVYNSVGNDQIGSMLGGRFGEYSLVEVFG